MARALAIAVRVTHWLWVVWWLGWSAALAVVFYERYWRVRDCFNELGRCYDAINQEVLLEQAGLVWGSAALLCMAFAAAGIIGLVRNQPALAVKR